MAAIISAHLKQISPTTTEGTVRQHSVLIDRPEAKGGTDKGAMGGEHLLIALGGCFMSNLLEVVRTREAPVTNIHVTVTGTLESAPARFSAVVLSITADYTDQAEMEKFVTIAERGCIVANTLKPAVELSFTLEKASN